MKSVAWDFALSQWRTEGGQFATTKCQNLDNPIHQCLGDQTSVWGTSVHRQNHWKTPIQLLFNQNTHYLAARPLTLRKRQIQKYAVNNYDRLRLQLNGFNFVFNGINTNLVAWLNLIYRRDKNIKKKRNRSVCFWQPEKNVGKLFHNKSLRC